MAGAASNPPLRLVAVASDVRRAQSLADRVAAAVGPFASPRLVGSVAEALQTLRREPFDAVVALHEPPALDALVLASALRGAGEETPLAVLGHARAIDLEAAAWEAGADEYACLAETTAAQLAGRLRRAVDARLRTREMRRLLLADQQRLARSRDEADEAVQTQQRLVVALRSLPTPDENPAASPLAAATRVLADDTLTEDYAALVRGSIVGDTLGDADLAAISDRFAAAGVTGPWLLERHLAAVATLTTGLGATAEPTVRRQADRVLLEAVVHLAEAYRRRYLATVPTVRETPAARAA